MNYFVNRTSTNNGNKHLFAQGGKGSPFTQVTSFFSVQERHL
jgi:hypothetical protein